MMPISNQPSVKCKKCGNYDVTKRGRSKSGNQRYFCKSCNSQFVADDWRKAEHREFKLIDNYRVNRWCKHCKQEVESTKFGKTSGGNQRYKCTKCNRTFSKKTTADGTLPKSFVKL